MREGNDSYSGRWPRRDRAASVDGFDDEQRQLAIVVGFDDIHDSEARPGSLRDEIARLEVTSGEATGPSASPSLVISAKRRNRAAYLPRVAAYTNRITPATSETSIRI